MAARSSSKARWRDAGRPVNTSDSITRIAERQRPSTDRPFWARPARDRRTERLIAGTEHRSYVWWMALSFVKTVERDVLQRAAHGIQALVAAPEVVAAWGRESALPGMTVGGLTRHLVSQPECAVEFLRLRPPPSHAPIVSLAELYRRTDWFTAPIDAVENTSIRDDFNAMAAGGPVHSAAILEQALSDLPAVIATAGPVAYVPWQDCALAIEDFLVVRVMEIVVHADDLSVSVGLPTPTFVDEVTDPVVALLATLHARRNGAGAAVRTLARAERADARANAFQGPPQTQ